MTRDDVANYVVVYWKDIPASVEAGEGNAAVRVALSPRFQELIDAVAMEQGLTGTDEYLGQWEKRPGGARPGEPRDVATAVAAELEKEYFQIRARVSRKRAQ